MKAFLLAGGLGERLRPLTDRLPKCLAPINGVPLLEIWLRLCAREQINAVLINVSRHADRVEDFLARRGGSDVDVRLVREAEPRGNAGTVAAHRDFVTGEQTFFVFYADNLVDVSLRSLLAFHLTHKGPLTMGLFRAPVPASAGIVQLSSDGSIVAFEEKPLRPRGDLANAGIYVARPAVFDAIPDGEVVDFGTHVFPGLQGAMHGVLLEGYLRDIGTPEGLAAACREWPSRAGAITAPLGTDQRSL